MERYFRIKPWWGDVPYTNLPDNKFSQLLFKIRSGTLPVLAFEGKRGSSLSTTCLCCRQGVDETIDHFLWECDGEAASIPTHWTRNRLLQSVRAILSASPNIMSHYGEQIDEDDIVEQVILGSPLEMIFPESFECTVSHNSTLPIEMRRTLTPEARSVVNRLQGHIMHKVSAWVKTLWHQRCAYVASVLQPPQSPSAMPVVTRGTQVRGGEREAESGSGRRERQRTIMEFFGPTRRERDIRQGRSHNNNATHLSGRGHVLNMPD